MKTTDDLKSLSHCKVTLRFFIDFPVSPLISRIVIVCPAANVEQARIHAKREVCEKEKIDGAIELIGKKYRACRVLRDRIGDVGVGFVAIGRLAESELGAGALEGECAGLIREVEGVSGRVPGSLQGSEGDADALRVVGGEDQRRV